MEHKNNMVSTPDIDGQTVLCCIVRADPNAPGPEV